MSERLTQRLAGDGIPEPCRFIPTGGQYPSAVRTEAGKADPGFMLEWLTQRRSSRDIPDLGIAIGITIRAWAIPAGRDDLHSVGAELHA